MEGKERRELRGMRGIKVKTKAKELREPDEKLKQERKLVRSEEMSTLCSLFMCIGFLILATFTIISIFDERSVLGMFKGKGLNGSVLNGNDFLVYLGDEAVPAAASPNEIIEAYDFNQIHATTHQYDWNMLHINGDYRYYGPAKEEAISKTGVDVSYYQEDIDWPKVKAAGIDFAIIRLGFRGYITGKMVLDTKFKQNIKGATDAGIDVGVYFFTQALTTQEAVEEAQFVLKNIGDYNLKYPIIIDTEAIDSSSARCHCEDLTADELTDICIAFCDTINAAGYKSSIYASKYWFLTQLNLERLDNYDKWLAYYTDVPEYPFEFSMWQYTDKGTVDGIKGKVDMNICFREY
ncbi:MAG: glycoside hydrolase family 25 protein [Lachnospiraceae bacterium]|nr:glycoside hydrolase family 25 protein [Lachnospiraceae bacterium]